MIDLKNFDCGQTSSGWELCYHPQKRPHIAECAIYQMSDGYKLQIRDVSAQTKAYVDFLAGKTDRIAYSSYFDDMFFVRTFQTLSAAISQIEAFEDGEELQFEPYRISSKEVREIANFILPGKRAEIMRKSFPPERFAGAEEEYNELLASLDREEE